MDDHSSRLGDHGRYPTSGSFVLRFSIADICWGVFCIACLLGIALASREQRYQASPFPKLFDSNYYTGIAKSLESTAFKFGGGTTGSISRSTRNAGDFQFIASDAFDIPTFVNAATKATNKSIKATAHLSGSEPIKVLDQIVGFQSEWQSDLNIGLVEIVYIGSREEKLRGHPEWSRVYHFRILTIEHQR